MRRSLVALLFVPLFLLSCVITPKKKIDEKVLPRVRPEALVGFRIDKNAIYFRGDIDGDKIPDTRVDYEMWGGEGPPGFLGLLKSMIMYGKDSDELQEYFVLNYIGKEPSPFVGDTIFFDYGDGGVVITAKSLESGKLTKFYYKMFSFDIKDYHGLRYEKTEPY